MRWDARWCSRAFVVGASLVVSCSSGDDGAGPAGSVEPRERSLEPTDDASRIASDVEKRIGRPLNTGVGGFVAVASRVKPRWTGQPSVRVEYGATSREPVTLTTLAGMRISLRLVTQGSAAGESAGAALVFPHAFAKGAHLVQTPLARGTEDFVLFERPPATGEARYELALTAGVAGLRLVERTLELLDSGGAPRIRMSPPWLVDGRGERRDATVRVEGCRVDRSPAPPWGRKTTPPGAAQCTVVVGFDPAGLSAPVVLDPLWTTTDTLGTGRYRHQAVDLSGGRVLAVAGCTNTSGTPCGTRTTTCEIYDEGTGTWATTGSIAAPGRWGHRLAKIPVAPERVLLAGGINASGTLNNRLDDAQIYDVGTGMWSATGTMARERGRHAIAVLPDNTIFAVGGHGNGGASAEIFEPSTGLWTLMVDTMSTARNLHTANVLSDGSVLVAGGTAATAERFQPGPNTFTATVAMQRLRHSHRAVTLPGAQRVLVIGGGSGLASQNFWNDSEVYTLGTNDFQTTPNTMTSKRRSPAVSLLDDGRVLAAAGRSALATHPVSADVFDPATDLWARAGSVAESRTEASATLLPSGKVLVAGGFNWTTLSNVALVRDSAELFEPQADGTSCTLGSECASTFCVDGVCCESACDATCSSCSAALNGVADGSCLPTTPGTDPDADCAFSAQSTCGLDGQCDGAGACRFWAAGTSCGAADCTGSTATTPECDGAGTCNPNSVSCAPYACDGASCGTSCTGDGDCASGSTCNMSTSQCETSADAGVDGAGGAAGAGGGAGTGGGAGAGGAAGSAGSAGAGGAAGSGGDGGVGLPNGSACGASAQCASGSCVDGVCCDSDCSRTCEACSAASKGYGTDGVCEPVAAGLDPRNECNVSGADCGADGACNGVGACREFSILGTQCGATTCAVDRVSGQVCDGAGTCVSLDEVSCAPFRCEGSACANDCSTDADCIAPAVCVSNVCIGRKPLGSACAGSAECVSALCIDGVCCNDVCNGQCEACDVAGELGNCSPVQGAPHGDRAECGGSGTCAGTCDGADPTECSFPTGLSCGAGMTCQGGECLQTERVCVKDDTASQAPDGSETACENYRCDDSSGECRTSCDVSSHCAEGFFCESSRCRREAPDKDDDGGCGCEVPGARGSSAPALLALMLLLTARRRRRARG